MFPYFLSFLILDKKSEKLLLLVAAPHQMYINDFCVFLLIGRYTVHKLISNLYNRNRQNIIHTSLDIR